MEPLYPQFVSKDNLTPAGPAARTAPGTWRRSAPRTLLPVACQVLAVVAGSMTGDVASAPVVLEMILRTVI
jgi:hypothetical protein